MSFISFNPVFAVWQTKHLSTHPQHQLIVFWVMREAGAYPTDHWVRGPSQGSHADKLFYTHMHTYSQFRVSDSANLQDFGGGRKLELVEETCADKGRTYKVLASTVFEAVRLWLLQLLTC